MCEELANSDHVSTIYAVLDMAYSLKLMISVDKAMSTNFSK